MRRNRTKLYILLTQLFLGLFFFFLWEILAYSEVINAFLVSKPSSIIKLFISYISSNKLLPHLLISTYETVVALVLSTTLGIAISLVLYNFPLVQLILDPYLTILNSLPKSSLGPIIIIILGTSSKGIIGVSISLSIIITIITSLDAFNKTDLDLKKMFISLGANKRQILAKLIIPSSFDSLLSIVKVNIGLSWVGTIVGEFLVSKQGIGYLLVYGAQVFKLDLVMMGIIVLSLISLSMYELVNFLQKIYRKKTHIK